MQVKKFLDTELLAIYVTPFCFTVFYLVESILEVNELDKVLVLITVEPGHLVSNKAKH